MQVKVREPFWSKDPLFSHKKVNKTKASIYTYFSLGKSVQAGKGAMRLALCEAPTRETRPDHYTGNSVPYSLRHPLLTI